MDFTDKFKSLNKYLIFEIYEYLYFAELKRAVLNTNKRLSQLFIDYSHKNFENIRNDRLLVSASFDSTIKIWKLNKTYDCINTLYGHTGDILSLCYLGSGMLASASDDRMIKVWSKYDGFRCINTLYGHTSDILALCYISNSNNSNDCLFSSGSSDNTIKIWSAFLSTCIMTLKGHSDSVLSLCYVEYGFSSFIISASKDITIKIWEINLSNQNENKNISASCIKTISDLIKEVTCLCNLPDEQIASSSSDGSIKIWCIYKNFKCIKDFNPTYSSIYLLSYIGNGIMISSDSNRMISMYDIYSNYNCTMRFKAHGDSIVSCIASSSGLMVTGSWEFEENIFMWSIDYDHKVKRIIKMTGHEDCVSALCFID